MTAQWRRQMPALPSGIKNIHLIGICGTGMGALAGMLKASGYEVRGSDRGAYPPMSLWLADRGIDIMPGYKAEHLQWGPDLVIVGNVARRDNPEAVEALRLGLASISFPEAIRAFFLKGKRPLVVTGTHGKTTTSAILAWLLESAGLRPGFMIGGVTGNFGSNFKLDDGEVFVIEGDEYDSAYFDKVPKFWHYEPAVATINNVEFDHADIYPNLEEISMVFERFARMLPADGQLWVNGDDARAVAATAAAACPVRRFGMGPDNDLRPTHVEHTSTGVIMDLELDGQSLGRFESPMPGEHNVRNFMGALALAMSQGVSPDQARAALPGFTSVKKRQELKGKPSGVWVYDDFAHHPSAVRETLQAIRARHPKARLWAAFEAKSNTSRMAIFQDDYPQAFDGADAVLLSAPWRQKSPEGGRKSIDLNQVVSDLQAMQIDAQLIPDVEDIIQHLAARVKPGDVILGMSGSSFSGFHDRMIAAINALSPQ